MILAILQARASSTRLPGKVLKPILGQPMLARQIERLKRARSLDDVIVATSERADDDEIARLCERLGVGCFRGSLDDVLDRFHGAAKGRDAAHVVRLTGDCPLASPRVIDALVAHHLATHADYTSTALEPTFPDGLDAEIMTSEALTHAWREARLPSEREHVTPFLYKHPERFRIEKLKHSTDLSELRWTVDEPSDFDFVTRVYEALYPTDPAFEFEDILRLLERHPELSHTDATIKRNAGYALSLRKDTDSPDAPGAPRNDTMSTRYHKSEQLLARALQSIPLGSQTFSKSKTQYPFGVSPYFIARGEGALVWDADGNEYIDFINALCSVSLGYRDPDVDAAVRAQLDTSGVIFSLPHELEMQVAEKLIEMVPCAEKVRFGKNGSDATSGAIRIARAYTGRDHVLVCGYHGWQDWYIGTTARNLGVPQATRDLTHTFPYNDLPALEALLEKFKGAVAAVILEPMNVTYPAEGYLEGVKALAHKHGAVLVFDETITGFRFSNGGAQALFGVTPDLATFGKAMANGYPVSAVAGRADIMRLMEEVFFSFTFGGETLSLAAALATMTKLQKEPVVDRLTRLGARIIAGVQELIGKHGAGDFLSVSGHPSWSFLLMKDVGAYTGFDLKTLFMQEVFARGILAYGTHNLSYAHTDAHVDRLLAVYDEVFAIMKDAVTTGTLHEKLACEPLKPLFKVR